MRLSLVLLLLTVAPLLWAEDLIFCGRGGAPEYEELFLDWGMRLRQTLIDQCDRAPEQVHLFVSPGAEQAAKARPLSLASLQAMFTDLKERHSPDEPLFIYMIGHGSHLRQEAKFQMQGMDLTATLLADMIADVPASAVVVINGSSASAGFVNALSAPNRVICAATKSSREINATEFMGFFVKALEEGVADRDSDQKISVYEACWRAASLTQNYYITQGLIATEHAILDDDGDGLGTRLQMASKHRPVARPSTDGLLASRLFIKDFRYPASVPRALVNSYQAQLLQIQQLKLSKQKLPAKTYRQRLETHLLEAARLNRRIHHLLPSVPKSKGK